MTKRTPDFGYPTSLADANDPVQLSRSGPHDDILQSRAKYDVGTPRSVPAYPSATCNCTSMVVDIEDAVSSRDGVDIPNDSFIEAITHSHIDEKGTMCT